MRDPRTRRWQVIRDAAALYLLITGVVYAVLLAEVDAMLTDSGSMTSCTAFSRSSWSWTGS
ncbi:hypothetical protein [Nocardia nepalensis]|uniref:hypothetical protein n=1 Tax=Nocardia nepalensis TaxID=3375448 RepID=UPI003B6771FA